jgi:AraC-like DNA-binding protein
LLDAELVVRRAGALPTPFARPAKAPEAVHVDYGKNWFLDALAKTPAMSRAGFALNFEKLVGVASIDYLANWRMQIAM